MDTSIEHEGACGAKNLRNIAVVLKAGSGLFVQELRQSIAGGRGGEFEPEEMNSSLIFKGSGLKVRCGEGVATRSVSDGKWPTAWILSQSVLMQSEGSPLGMTRNCVDTPGPGPPPPPPPPAGPTNFPIQAPCSLSGPTPFGLQTHAVGWVVGRERDVTTRARLVSDDRTAALVVVRKNPKMVRGASVSHDLGPGHLNPRHVGWCLSLVLAVTMVRSRPHQTIHAMSCHIKVATDPANCLQHALCFCSVPPRASCHMAQGDKPAHVAPPRIVYFPGWALFQWTGVPTLRTRACSWQRRVLDFCDETSRRMRVAGRDESGAPESATR
ncbi:hypothetical protein AXG93_3426s1040 [Marchantia polymorpha subsp. ruderalis]|uniref:Uncharacterized protein n=1 Tax=Marchantia polymorpha subsp. ruderalis TaxID=1480154 RepID=A0A176VDL6_MARPO|nr:hypothetical protein AXG93_3426s1040 [Marchantia polymorpha subsp. ruderalis]